MDLNGLKIPIALLVGVVLGAIIYSSADSPSAPQPLTLAVEELPSLADPSLPVIQDPVLEEQRSDEPEQINTYEIWCNCLGSKRRVTGGGALPEIPYEDQTYTMYRANLRTTSPIKEITTAYLNAIGFCPEDRLAASLVKISKTKTVRN